MTAFMLPSILSLNSRHQQYECKWYIPLADLTFQTLDDSDSCHSVQVLPEHEIEEMKIKISALKNEIQKEKVQSIQLLHLTADEVHIIENW